MSVSRLQGGVNNKVVDKVEEMIFKPFFFSMRSTGKNHLDQRLDSVIQSSATADTPEQ